MGKRVPEKYLIRFHLIEVKFSYFLHTKQPNPPIQLLVQGNSPGFPGIDQPQPGIRHAVGFNGKEGGKHRNQVLGFEGYLVFLVTFSPFGDGQFFEGDNFLGVKFLSHEGA